MKEYLLSSYDASLITQSREWSEYFELAFQVLNADDKMVAAKHVVNWMSGELAAYLNRQEIDITRSVVSAPALGMLLKRNADGTLNNKMTKEVFAAMCAGEQGGDPDAIIAARGLKQISDSGEIEKIVDQVLAANAQQVADFRAGREKAFNSLVGQAMKATKGKANPQQVNEILRRKLSG